MRRGTGSTRGRGDLRRTLAMFRRFAGGARRSTAGAVVLMAVEAATAIAIPDLIGKVIDFLKTGRHVELLALRPSAAATIPVLAAAIVLVTAVNSLAESLSEVSLAKTGRALGYNVRTALFAHLQKLSIAFHVRRSTGDVLTRITGDVQALEEFVVDSVKDLIGSAMLLVATLIYLFWASWRIALLAVVIVPLLASISSYFARRIKAASKELRAREGDLASTAQEMLTTISVVQIYGRASHEQRKFARESRAAMDAILRTSRLEALFSFTVSVLEAAVIAVVVVVGARLVDSNTINAGLLVTFILLIQGMFKPTRRIIKEWNTVGKIYASVERIGELLDREPAVQDAPQAVEAPALSGAVEFRDVSFAYQSQLEEDADGEPARLTLSSVSFVLEAGEVVALVGHSGAGKSTIAQLLPRLYDPQAGAVLMDDWDIRAFTVDSLRSQISMVLQETILLRGTVAENIAYGREGATLEEVVTAAQRAQAHDFIMAMPQGYDTVLGERAATLSGGQRQRLAIARAFIRDTPILVLDEPTTGLDAQASASVTEALHTLLRGRTAVIVSHDLNLIRDVDRILVLSGGRILEEGTPADLLARGGLYADLYASQFGAAMAGAASPTDGVVAGGLPRVPASPQGAPWPSGLGADEDGLPMRETPFENVLMDAMPMPATNREFDHLTGWGPPGRAAHRPAADAWEDVDALRSPLLLRTLPGLPEAVDATAMAPRLQRLLAPGWQLASCITDKVLVDPEGGATLRYRLRLQGGSGGLEERLVAGRLFSSADLAERHLSGLARLAEEARDRADLRVFARVVGQEADLGLVLGAFPLDPDLPGLLPATDPARMGMVLEPVLPSSLPGLALQTCHAEVVKYAAGQQCVLRYELLWRVQPSRRTVRQVVYGRLYADERGSRVGPTITAVREHLLQTGAAASLPFLLPRSQGYLPGLRLALLDALPGTPQVRALVREDVALGRSTGPGALSAEAALAACARVAGALHTSVPASLTADATPGEVPGTLADAVTALRADLDAVAPFAPAVARMLGGRVDSLAQAVSAATMPSVLAHGGFTPSKVLFDGPMTGVYDWDTACSVEPAVDLGRFLGELAVVARGAAQTAGQGAERARDFERVFLDEYVQVRRDMDEDTLRERVAAYRTLTLLAIALRSWRRLKPERLRVAGSLLGDPDLVRP